MPYWETIAISFKCPMPNRVFILKGGAESERKCHVVVMMQINLSSKPHVQTMPHKLQQHPPVSKDQGTLET
ncbi:hypothetical protein JCM39068_43180 [Desulfocastanea catecholica]